MNMHLATLECYEQVVILFKKKKKQITVLENHQCFIPKNKQTKKNM